MDPFELVLLLVWGLVVGAFARLALPGRDPMKLWQTMLVGLAGSALAAVFSLLILDRWFAGFLLCLVFSTLIMYVVRRSRGGGLLDPGIRSPER